MINIAATGQFKAALKLSPSLPWRGMTGLSLDLDQQAASPSADLRIEHQTGNSALHLTTVDNGHQLRVDGDPLPIAEMLGSDWPLAAVSAPSAVDMRGSALRMDASGVIEGALRLGFTGGWAGLQRLNIDQISLIIPGRNRS